MQGQRAPAPPPRPGTIRRAKNEAWLSPTAWRWAQNGSTAHTATQCTAGGSRHAHGSTHSSDRTAKQAGAHHACRLGLGRRHALRAPAHQLVHSWQRVDLRQNEWKEADAMTQAVTHPPTGGRLCNLRRPKIACPFFCPAVFKHNRYPNRSPIRTSSKSRCRPFWSSLAAL